MSNKKTVFSIYFKDILEANASSRSSLPLSVSRQQQRWIEFTKADERAKRIIGPQKIGFHRIGRDDMGLLVENPGFKVLRMVLEPGCPRVTVFFRKEDKEQINGSWKEIERDMKHFWLAKKDVESSTHFIRAIRSFKDMRADYQAELLFLERMIQSIEPQETVAPTGADSNQRWRKIVEGLKTDAGLDSLISSLSALRSVLTEKELALLHIVAAGRVEETINAFQAIRELPQEKRAAPLTTATARLDAVRNRLHSRQLGIAHLMRMAKYREDAMRPVRDRWLFYNFAAFSSGINNAFALAKEDLRRRDVLSRVLGMLNELEALEKNVGRFKRKTGWSEKDDRALESKLGEYESLSAKMKSLPWFDAKDRSNIQGAIRRLKKKDNLSPEEEARLAGLESTIEGMKWQVKTFETENSKVMRSLRESIHAFQKRRDEHEANIGPLESAEKAYLLKSSEATRCLWANWALFESSAIKPTALSGDYGWIHRSIKEGDLQRARRKALGKLQELDDSDPRFILDELSKAPDPYLAETLAPLTMAVGQFELALKSEDKKQVSESLKIAQARFTESAMSLRDFVFPKKP